MPVTLATELTNLGIDLDDTNANLFTATKLTMWINQGCVEIARRAECLMATESSPLPANQSITIAPANTVRIYELTYSPYDPTQIYPLKYMGRQEMNSIWYINQQTPTTYPSYYTTWSNPPNIFLQIFPVPSQAGIMQFWYYRLPQTVVNNTDIIDLPEGYEDVLRAYVRFNARRMAGDPIWQDDKALFEEGLDSLVTNSRNWTDQMGQITQGGAMVPGWLYGGWGG